MNKLLPSYLIYIYYAIFILTGAVFAYLANESVLLFKGHETSEYILEKFSGLNFYLTILVPLFTLILLVISNLILFRKGPGNFFFLTLIYFTGFIIVHYLFVNEQFIYFKSAVGAWEGSLSINWIIAIVIIFIGANIIVLNYFVAKRLLRR